jgi:hypothetical protein
MSNGTTTEARTVRFACKKINCVDNMWFYRGWIIKMWNNCTLNDSDTRGKQFNTYRSMEGYLRGGAIDIVKTLKDAKSSIDDCEDR